MVGSCTISVMRIAKDLYFEVSHYRQPIFIVPSFDGGSQFIGHNQKVQIDDWEAIDLSVLGPDTEKVSPEVLS
jgi:hypothetical protein